jgi:hypothetical protein
MAADPNARRDFISRVGTFFVVIGLFAITIFAASDISRNNARHKTAVTQTFIVEAIQAIQTRDAGATKAALQNRPTPRLIPVPNHEVESTLAYLPLFCIGSIGLLLGWFFKRISTIPGKPGTRFEGIRKMLQKQREAKAKREKEKKEKKEKAEKAKKK